MLSFSVPGVIKRLQEDKCKPRICYKCRLTKLILFRKCEVIFMLLFLSFRNIVFIQKSYLSKDVFNSLSILPFMFWKKDSSLISMHGSLFLQNLLTYFKFLGDSNFKNYLPKKLQLCPVILQRLVLKSRKRGASGRFKVWYLMIPQDKNGAFYLLKETGLLQFFHIKWFFSITLKFDILVSLRWYFSLSKRCFIFYLWSF